MIGFKCDWFNLPKVDIEKYRLTHQEIMNIGLNLSVDRGLFWVRVSSLVADAQLIKVQPLIKDAYDKGMEDGNAEAARANDRLKEAVRQARKEGREQVKTYLLNHVCHIGRSDRQYAYLGTEYIKQCKEWDALKEG